MIVWAIIVSYRSVTTLKTHQPTGFAKRLFFSQTSKKIALLGI